MKKLNLALLFGGRSCEHRISVISARSILAAIDRDKYNLFLIGIDRAGHWHLADDFEALLEDGAVNPPTHAADRVTLALHHHGNLSPAAGSTRRQVVLPALDVIFPALHGTFGEDGTLQGVFELAGIPFVGCGVAASAVAMDKILAKKILAAAGIPQAAYIGLTAAQWARDPAEILDRGEVRLGYPIFVKPANLGSSVGIGKAHGRAQLRDAIESALRFDTRIVLEQSLENCMEVECAVLGNDDARASVVGEIIPGGEFYDYAAKYLEDTAELVVPANLPEHAAEQVRQLSVSAFREIDGAGLARVDFFVDRDTWAVTLNEINTLPGFTPISMYPRLWAASGVPYNELIDRLIELAVERQLAKAALQRAFEPPEESS